MGDKKMMSKNKEKPRIRVLVINTVRFKLNGIAAVIKNYYMAMDKAGIEMEFVAIDEPSSEYKQFFEENRLICYVLQKKNIVNYFAEIIRICRRGRYDIVHVHGNSANMSVELLACWIGGVKNRIAHSHNTSTLHPLTHNLLWPLFSRLCTVGLACGEDAGKWLFRKKTFITLKNGIDVKKYTYNFEMREKYRKKIGADYNAVVIGHIGNFTEQKNHAFLVEFFSKLYRENHSFKLLLIGEGALMPVIKDKVRALGLEESVIFAGKTMEVENYLQAMDVFVLPSLYEGFPLVLVEAQVAGVPCVISDKVSREADIAETSTFLPIDCTEPWVREISDSGWLRKDRMAASAENQVRIQSKGYDIAENADQLRQIYFKLCGEN